TVRGGVGSEGDPRAEQVKVATRTLTPSEVRLREALEAGVREAAQLGGEVEAAAMLDSSPAPLVATSAPGGAERYMRMWSISKVATTVTLLRLLGWEDRQGEMPSHELLEALAGAMTRSENCRQRRVVLELQRAAGGIPETREALSETFSLVEGEAIPGSQVAAPEALCVPFLEEQLQIPEPLAPALLLGTSRWRITDAARLAHGLAVETYGEAVSEAVFELMEAPKRPSRETQPGELTAPLDWGAGSVFEESAPAYKAAWGGTLNGNFLAGQIAVVPLEGGDHLALAVMFHPDVQPPRDDPGITTAPAAVETLMRAVRSSTSPSGSQAHRESESATPLRSD
ncbi:MAG TPA: hypothetical protein VFY69_09630, partial [Solirubrobacterales bacterium]|nr:hypothetical protein [Solirubrobacterales bacterium]